MNARYCPECGHARHEGDECYDDLCIRGMPDEPEIIPDPRYAENHLAELLRTETARADANARAASEWMRRAGFEVRGGIEIPIPHSLASPCLFRKRTSDGCIEWQRVGWGDCWRELRGYDWPKLRPSELRAIADLMEKP